LRHAWDDVFGGGVWWTDDHTHGVLGRGYKNAITNELFLFASTSLYKATGNSTFLHWAEKELSWFLQSGMINREYLVNDGLDKYGHNNNGTTWSYNQGVILGGLADMYNITGNSAYLALALNISGAAMKVLVDKEGVFSEVCDGGKQDVPPCVLNDDARIFKGIFVRYVGHLIQALQALASTSGAGDFRSRSSSISPVQARAALSDISEFVKFNFAHVSADPRNSATWSTCGAAPMPRPSPGSVWQSARESVFAGYTSTLSTLDLAIVHALIYDIESAQ
jgi:predicted alpha-1,6-mannanase (GH76 family)